ncbi:MAG: hypothetical protein ACOCX1_04005 [Fimbriimonadaceae bacterium]
MTNRVGAVGALLALMLLIGCGGSNRVELPDPTIRFINGSPDVGAIDFYLNNDIVGNSFDYLDDNSRFLTVDFPDEFLEQSWDLIAQEANGVREFDAVATEFERNTHSMVVLFGLEDPLVSELEKRARLEIVEVDRLEPVGNRARLVIFHGFNREEGKQTPAIDFKNPGDNPLFAAENIAYGESQVLSVEAGTNTWNVERSDAEGDVIYTSEELTLEGGHIYFVLVSGLENAADPALGPTITLYEIATL